MTDPADFSCSEDAAQVHSLTVNNNVIFTSYKEGNDSFRSRSYCSVPALTANSLLTELKEQKKAEPDTWSDEDLEKQSSCCFRCLSIRMCWQKNTVHPASLPRDTSPSRCTPLRRAKSSRSFRRHNQVETDSSPGCFWPSLGKYNKRDWGEEREGDVIYAIRLKRINRNPTANNNKSPEGLLWETQKVRHIKGATLPFLVRHLCRSFVEDYGERHFLTVFLATYRSFASPEEVLNLIIKETENLKNEQTVAKQQVLCSTIRVLRTWLDRYFHEDFDEPPDYLLLKTLRRLVEDLQAKRETKVSEFLEFINAKMKSLENEPQLDSNPEKASSLSLPLKLNLSGSCRSLASGNEEPLNMEAAKTFLNVLSPQQIAEQLTAIDAKLFLRVVPHHCLYAVRSSKGKPATVKATIDQFNHVVYCVLAVCLCHGFKPQQRAKIFCKWIEVAQAFRELKNFSSLRAVISGLQTHPIHRLRRIWHHVPQGFADLLKELGQINTKDSLQKVGTAKVNTEQSAIDRVRRDASVRRQNDIHQGITHGTVPYLGSFLTDLTYLHTARKDYIEDNYINFDKRRKEFELLAQLQLWQVTCRSYHHIEIDQRFSDWFNSVTLPTDEQAIKLSEELEPPNTSPLSPQSTPSKRFLSDALHSLHNYHSFGLPPNGSATTSFPVSRAKSAGKEVAEARLRGRKQLEGKVNGHARTVSSVEEERVVKVQIVTKHCDDVITTEPDKRKELKLSSNDRSPAFVRKAFNLFHLNEQDANKFKIMQILPGHKELEIPDNGNVFYAMNSTADQYNFMLVEEGADVPRVKTESDHSQSTPKSKKFSRKSAVSPHSLGSTSSPMKTIYRHLGINGFLWANNGYYSPMKAADRGQAHEEVCDGLEKVPGETSSLCGSLIERTTSSGSQHSLSSHWRKLKKSDKNRNRNVSSSDHLETYKPLEESTVSPNPSACDLRTFTWPRNQKLSDEVTKSRLQRRAAIRKHHSHPRDSTFHAIDIMADDRSQDSVSAESSKDGSATSLDEDRCDYTSAGFVTYKQHQDLQRHASVEMLRPDMNGVTTESKLYRFASDPCILDSVEAESEVFPKSPEVDSSQSPSHSQRHTKESPDSEVDSSQSPSHPQRHTKESPDSEVDSSQSQRPTKESPDSEVDSSQSPSHSQRHTKESPDSITTYL